MLRDGVYNNSRGTWLVQNGIAYSLSGDDALRIFGPGFVNPVGSTNFDAPIAALPRGDINALYPPGTTAASRNIVPLIVAAAVAYWLFA